MSSREMKRVSVVIVDDHPAMIEGLKSFLQQIDYVDLVGEAYDGIKALKVVGETTPDVLLLDVELPGRSGLEVIQELKTASHKPTVIAISTYDNYEYVNDVLANGALGYIYKSEASIDALDEAICKTFYYGKRYISPHISQCYVEAIIDNREDLRMASELTQREKEVLYLVSQARSIKEISELSGISLNTVKNHLASIKDKLEMDTHAKLVRWGLTHEDLLPKSSRLEP